MNVCVVATPDEWIVPCPVVGHIRFPRDGRWKFDGNFERPTFTPRLVHRRGEPGQTWEAFKANPNPNRNHVIVTEGKIHYQPDCTHDLKGQVRPIVPFTVSEIAYYRSRFGPEAVGG